MEGDGGEIKREQNVLSRRRTRGLFLACHVYANPTCQYSFFIGLIHSALDSGIESKQLPTLYYYVCVIGHYTTYGRYGNDIFYYPSPSMKSARKMVIINNSRLLRLITTLSFASIVWFSVDTRVDVQKEKRSTSLKNCRYRPISNSTLLYNSSGISHSKLYRTPTFAFSKVFLRRPIKFLHFNSKRFELCYRCSFCECENFNTETKRSILNRLIWANRVTYLEIDLRR